MLTTFENAIGAPGIDAANRGLRGITKASHNFLHPIIHADAAVVGHWPVEIHPVQVQLHIVAITALHGTNEIWRVGNNGIIQRGDAFQFAARARSHLELKRIAGIHFEIDNNTRIVLPRGTEYRERATDGRI